ncbi:MAG: methyltransferase [Parvibaculaceae bacterium]
MKAVDHAKFVADNTAILSPPLVPEIRLHLAHEAVPVWRKTEEELGEIGLPPPFWAFAWAGGQALSRHVLDRPRLVEGRSVLDLATGSGLVAIAAAKAGARSVLAADIDPFACAAARLNAQVNGVAIAVSGEDLLENVPRCFDLVLVGDLFYEKALAERVHGWLVAAKTKGADILIGDPGRSYLPKPVLRHVADYHVPVTRELEDAEIKRTSVWRI